MEIAAKLGISGHSLKEINGLFSSFKTDKFSVLPEPKAQTSSRENSLTAKNLVLPESRALSGDLSPESLQTKVIQHNYSIPESIAKQCIPPEFFRKAFDSRVTNPNSAVLITQVSLSPQPGRCFARWYPGMDEMRFSFVHAGSPEFAAGEVIKTEGLDLKTAYRTTTGVTDFAIFRQGDNSSPLFKASTLPGEEVYAALASVLTNGKGVFQIPELVRLCERFNSYREMQSGRQIAVTVHVPNPRKG